LDLGEYGRLIDILCEDIPNLPRIPYYAQEGARRITKLILTYYPTQGRRRIAIVVVALAIARGNYEIHDFKDLMHRVKYFVGEEIPKGQIYNTFEDISTFLRNLEKYKLNRRRYFKLTPEEKRILKIIKRKHLKNHLSYKARMLF
jgi:hypothetical protein